MSSQRRAEQGFWKTLGRCRRCMDPLTVLSVLCWIIWWLAFRDHPQSLESIALILTGFIFNFLLFLHLWMRFVILPWQRRAERKEKEKKEKKE